jgi:FkbM family methyltransferase
MRPVKKTLPSTRHSFLIGDVHIEVFDSRVSRAAEIVAHELREDVYRLEQKKFRAGDVVIDVGGHIGLFAIYLGLRFPKVVIHSFEPFPDNYELFRRNLALNPVPNVHLHNLALSGDGRCLEMVTNPQNSGGATCNSTTLHHRRTRKIPSWTLDQVFDSLGLKKCKLLKIDCEGSEYEILLPTSVLSRVEYLCGEFHKNRLLATRGYSVVRLCRHCVEYIDPKKITLQWGRMSE